MPNQYEQSHKWRPEVLAHLATLSGSYRDKADALNKRFPGGHYNASQVRQKLASLPAGKPPADLGDTRLRDFLSRARTLPEIATRMGCSEGEATAMLTGDFGNLRLFRTRDDYGHETFILLRQPDVVPRVQPRAWDCTLQTDPRTGVPIYMAAQFHDHTERIKIIPIADTHYGHQAHLHEKFRATLRYIEEHEGVYWFGGGDLMENALDDGRGYIYSQQYHPQQQWLDMLDFFAPIAHKCLFLHSGNHEDRTSKRAGVEILEPLAKMLNVPYFNFPLRLRMLWQGHDWGAHIMHGRSASQTKGGKHNAAARPRIFNDFVEFVVSFHVHDPIDNAVSCIVEDKANLRVALKKQYVVIGPAMLGFWGTYAHKAGYEPPGMGGVGMHIYPDGGYDAVFTSDSDENWATSNELFGEGD